jgi:hypothetical protein
LTAESPRPVSQGAKSGESAQKRAKQRVYKAFWGGAAKGAGFTSRAAEKAGIEMVYSHFIAGWAALLTAI